MLTLTPFRMGRALSEKSAMRRLRLSLCGVGESSVFVHEFYNSAEPKSPLAPLRSVMAQPTPVRISADGSRADAQQTASLLQRELRIEQSPNQVLAGLFEFAPIVVGRHRVVVVVNEELNVLRQLRPHFLKFGVDGLLGGNLGSLATPSRTWRAHHRLLEASFLISGRCVLGGSILVLKSTFNIGKRVKFVRFQCRSPMWLCKCPQTFGQSQHYLMILRSPPSIGACPWINGQFFLIPAKTSQRISIESPKLKNR